MGRHIIITNADKACSKAYAFFTAFLFFCFWNESSELDSFSFLLLHFRYLATMSTDGTNVYLTLGWMKVCRGGRFN